MNMAEAGNAKAAMWRKLQEVLTLADKRRGLRLTWVSKKKNR